MVGFISKMTVDWKAAQLLAFALVVMIVSFYTGTLFGHNSASVYETLLPQKDQQRELPPAVNGSAQASG